MDPRGYEVEVVKTFDGNHIRTGEMERQIVHREGVWHETFHCWFVAEIGGIPCVLVQLRSPTKKNYPNFLDITAAGHLEAQESPMDGIREIKEELGVDVDPGRLVFLGIKHDIQDEPNGIRNREFSHVFLYRDDRPLTRYKLQEDEVSALVAIPISTGLEVVFGKKSFAECQGVRLREGSMEDFTTEVRIDSFIPRVDWYYRKIFALADQWLRGYEYLAI
jgi:isopentenyldiphosphate isomerase